MKTKTKKRSPINNLSFTITCAVLIFPLLNVLLFRGLGLFFLTEPTIYPKFIPDVFALIFEYVSGILTFFPPLCITYSIITGKRIVTSAVLSIFSVPLIYVIRVLEDVLINSQTLYVGLIKTALFDWLSVLVCYGLIAVAAVLISKRSKPSEVGIELFSLKGALSKGIAASTAITLLVSALQSAAETYVAVRTEGAPTNFSDILELTSPYIALLIEAFIAYIAAYFTIKRQEGLHKSRELRK